jgi:hypothetical protein
VSKAFRDLVGTDVFGTLMALVPETIHAPDSRGEIAIVRRRKMIDAEEEENMKKWLLWGFCSWMAWAGSVFAQERMIITYRDGRVQTIDTGSILKIEYQSAPTAGVPGMGPQATVAGMCSLQSYNYPNHFIRHANFLGEITPISSDLDRKDSTFRIVAGLADSRHVSFESLNYPGHYLRHQDFRLKLQKFDGSQLFRQDATFKMVPGLADGSWSSFESVNYPGHYIRHRNFHLYIERGNDDLFRKDVTFRAAPPNS